MAIPLLIVGDKRERGSFGFISHNFPRGTSYFFCLIFSLFAVAPQLKVGMNRLTVTGEKGYSMIRATHGNWITGWGGCSVFVGGCYICVYLQVFLVETGIMR